MLRIIQMATALSLLLSSATLPAAHASSTVVGSFNIRYDNPKDASQGNGWEQRAPVIASLIRFHQFDILGVQEALHHQVEKLQTLLPAYASSGCGRDDGKTAGEYAAIFYRKDAYTLKDSGRFWLSPTPEVPSLGWDAKFNRICSWVKLESNKTQQTFYVFNTHFDHHGVTARAESTRLLLSSIKTIAGDHAVFLVGDFNFDQASEPYKTIVNSGLLHSSHDAAEERYALNGTTSGFDVNTYSEKHIDHIFHSTGFKVTRYGVLTDNYRMPTENAQEIRSPAFPEEIKFKQYLGRTPSDHFPVLAEFE